jgi:hypothetical protein
MFSDKIGESCTTAGTATFQLGGAYGAFRTWRSGFSTLDLVFYLATKDDGTVWEVGYGTLTYGSPDTLSRDGVIASSTGGPKISWSGTYRIYNVPIGLAMKLMQAPMINGVANIPLWVPAGFTWIDYSLGISTEWVENVYVSGTRTTATSHVEKGRYKIGLSGGEPNIHAPTMRQRWTDVGAANKTVAADDIDGFFTFDNSAAGRTMTLPQASGAGIGHGFTVGGLGKSQNFVITVTPNASDSIEGGTAGASRSVTGGVLFLMKWDGANSTWRIIVWGLNTSGVVGAIPFSGRRQTALSGPTDSSGNPTFLATVSGLTLSTSNLSTATPLILSVASGFSVQGQVDRFAIATANFSFGTLPNTSTNYLYVDVDLAGNITGGNTTTGPIYQYGGTYPVTNGQWTFNINDKVGKLGNGSVATQVWRIFIGEADTSGGNVTAVRPYAYNGFAISGYTTPLPNQLVVTTFNHNIGVPPIFIDYAVECLTAENGYAIGDRISAVGSLSVNDAATIVAAAMYTNRNRMATTPNLWGALHASGTPTNVNLTRANWKGQSIADRGW